MISSAVITGLLQRLKRVIIWKLPFELRNDFATPFDTDIGKTIPPIINDTASVMLPAKK